MNVQDCDRAAKLLVFLRLVTKNQLLESQLGVFILTKKKDEGVSNENLPEENWFACDGVSLDNKPPVSTMPRDTFN